MRKIPYIEIILILWRFSYIPEICNSLFSISYNQLKQFSDFFRIIYFSDYIPKQIEKQFFEVYHERVLSKNIAFRNLFFYLIQVSLIFCLVFVCKLIKEFLFRLLYQLFLVICFFPSVIFRFFESTFHISRYLPNY